MGAIAIAVHKETTPKEDVYMIQVDTIKGIEDIQALYELLSNEVGNPERFVIQQDGVGWNIYTKQTDAAAELALFMNQNKDIHLNMQDSDSILNPLMQLQKI